LTEGTRERLSVYRGGTPTTGKRGGEGRIGWTPLPIGGEKQGEMGHHHVCIAKTAQDQDDRPLYRVTPGEVSGNSEEVPSSKIAQRPGEGAKNYTSKVDETGPCKKQGGKVRKEKSHRSRGSEGVTEGGKYRSRAVPRKRQDRRAGRTGWGKKPARPEEKQSRDPLGKVAALDRINT